MSEQFTLRWTELRAMPRRQFEDYVLQQVQRYRCDPSLAAGFADETWRAEMRAELHRMTVDREVHDAANGVRDHRAFFRKIAARHGLAVGANQRITREAPHRALVFEAVFFMVLLRAMPDPAVADSEYLGWATMVCRYGVSKVHHGMHLVRLLTSGIAETHEYVHTYQQRRAVFEQARKDAVFLPAFLPIVPPPVDQPALPLFSLRAPLPSLPLSSSASVLAQQPLAPSTMRGILDRVDAELTAAELLFRAGETDRVHAALFHVAELVVEAHRAQHALLVWCGKVGGEGTAARLRELAVALQRHAALILLIASSAQPAAPSSSAQPDAPFPFSAQPDAPSSAQPDAAQPDADAEMRGAKRARESDPLDDRWIDDISVLFADEAGADRFF